MKRLIRTILRVSFVALLTPIAYLFFDHRYLHGRYFEGSVRGWRWVIRSIFWQKLLGFNRNVPWPVHPFVRVIHPHNITFHPDDLNNFQSSGIYFQAIDKIVMGKNTYIAPNVGLITSNHDPCFPHLHQTSKAITLGSDCWVGMNSVILPGVVLGNHTVVAAGSVVTKSFPQGNCIIAGVPARIIKHLDCD